MTYLDIYSTSTGALRITHMAAQVCGCASHTRLQACTKCYDLTYLYTRERHECENRSSSSLKADLELHCELFSEVEVCKSPRARARHFKSHCHSEGLKFVKKCEAIMGSGPSQLYRSIVKPL